MVWIMGVFAVVLSERALKINPSSTLAIDSKAKKMRADGIDVISFGAGEPDFDTPAHVREAAIQAINNGFTRYTAASGILELKRAICNKLKRENNIEYSPDEIIVSNGAKHSLMNVFNAICNPDDEIIIPAPYWVSYPEMVQFSGGVPVILNTTEEEGFKFSISELEKVITDETKAIVLNSPSNPTGAVYTKDELTAIAKICVERDIFLISDEVYEHFIYTGEGHTSIASLGEDIKRLTITVNGVSKTYAMTGWRIGYTASNAEIARIMGNLQSHSTSNPNSVAQKAAVAALEGPQEQVDIMIKEFRKRRDFMVEKINSIPGLSCRSPQGAFYAMMNISKYIGQELSGRHIDGSDKFAETLLEFAKVAVVPGSGFGTDIHVRLSYATSMDNIKRGLERIEEYLKNQVI